VSAARSLGAWLRISYRQQRWELIFVVAGIGLATVAMLWAAGQVEATRSLREDCLSTATIQEACNGRVSRAWDAFNRGQSLLGVTFLMPFAVALILGTPLVAREIEGGTAPLAWSLSRSRVSWLLRRVAFVALVVVILLGGLAIASDRLAAAMYPERNLAQDFDWYGQRGWLIVARGLGVLGLCVLSGAMLGRVLPAILAAAILAGASAFAIGSLNHAWLKSEAVVMRMDPQSGLDDQGALFVNGGLQLVDGTALTWDEIYYQGIIADISDEEGSGAHYASEADLRAGKPMGYDAAWVIPGRRYPEIVARESAEVGGAGLLALAVTALVVTRRRPA
jgi:ABC-type transport system involved in multi-copper enzyme maturation permease subunit